MQKIYGERTVAGTLGEVSVGHSEADGGVWTFFPTKGYDGAVWGGDAFGTEHDTQAEAEEAGRCWWNEDQADKIDRDVASLNA